MTLAIVVLELKRLPDGWTKEHVASYIDQLFSADLSKSKSQIRVSIAAAKVFRVIEE